MWTPHSVYRDAANDEEASQPQPKAQQCNTHQLGLDVHDGALSPSHLLHPLRRIHHTYSHPFRDGDEIGGRPLTPISLRRGPREPLQPPHGDAFFHWCIHHHHDNTADDGDGRTNYRIGHHNSCDE